VSCAAWHIGASAVAATDRAEVLPLLRANVEANCVAAASASTRAPVVVVAQMWGEALGPELASFAAPGGGLSLSSTAVVAASVETPLLVFAVDCIYDESAVAPLLQTLRALLRPSRPKPPPLLHGAGAQAEAVALVACDEAYKRPAALEAFCRGLAEAGLAARALGTGHLAASDRRDSIRLWCVKAATT